MRAGNLRYARSRIFRMNMVIKDIRLRVFYVCRGYEVMDFLDILGL